MATCGRRRASPRATRCRTSTTRCSRTGSWRVQWWMSWRAPWARWAGLAWRSCSAWLAHRCTAVGPWVFFTASCWGPMPQLRWPRSARGARVRWRPWTKPVGSQRRHRRQRRQVHLRPPPASPTAEPKPRLALPLPLSLPLPLPLPMSRRFAWHQIARRRWIGWWPTARGVGTAWQRPSWSWASTCWTAWALRSRARRRCARQRPCFPVRRRCVRCSSLEAAPPLCPPLRPPSPAPLPPPSCWAVRALWTAPWRRVWLGAVRWVCCWTARPRRAPSATQSGCVILVCGHPICLLALPCCARRRRGSRGCAT
mmetsp:Transcript_2538/g.7489  ORF Transcript_2538/g.7489 Transcript_2538/m.7489 type:complete len:311 (+) Transcript_2538:131-1063(+)